MGKNVVFYIALKFKFIEFMRIFTLFKIVKLWYYNFTLKEGYLWKKQQTHIRKCINFWQYLAVEKNTSALTVKNYAADIDIFAGFLKTRYPGGFNWQEINVLDIRSYLADMNGKKYARTTIARRISALRSFYKYLQRENKVKQNPL